MEVVKIKDIVGENAVTQEDGQKIYDRIIPALGSDQSVELDFEGVKIFASPFFNAAVGQLIREIKVDDLNRLLRVKELSPLGQEVLRRVIENAKQYFSSENYRKAQTEAIAKLAHNN